MQEDAFVKGIVPLRVQEHRCPKDWLLAGRRADSLAALWILRIRLYLDTVPHAKGSLRAGVLKHKSKVYCTHDTNVGTWSCDSHSKSFWNVCGHARSFTPRTLSVRARRRQYLCDPNFTPGTLAGEHFGGYVYYGTGVSHTHFPVQPGSAVCFAPCQEPATEGSREYLATITRGIVCMWPAQSSRTVV